MNKIGNIMWGIVLIAIGIIIGGNALEIINIDIFFDGWWTLFIIVPSFIGIWTDKEKAGNITGLIIGIALLLVCQDILDFEIIWKLAIPIILIAIGLSTILKDVFNKKVNDQIKKLNQKINSTHEYCATFGAQNINLDGEKFEGATLNAIFGSIKCDLRKAVIDKDTVINASSIFGGIEIFVPDNVKVKIKGTPIFGGVSNKIQPSDNENSPIIYINATALFGGVEIK